MKHHKKHKEQEQQLLEAWQLPDDPKAANMPKCAICGLATYRKDSYGNPLCEFCAEDYKQMMSNKWDKPNKRHQVKNPEYNEDDSDGYDDE